MQKPTSTLQSFYFARDNIVSAIGKIIKFQAECINLGEAISLWLSWLPLKYDLEEAKINYELLSDMCLYRSDLVIPTHQTRVFELLVYIKGLNYIGEALREKIEKILNPNSN